MAKGYHIPLIGGHIGGTGVYSGPLFVWLLSPIFFITKGNPLLTGSLVSLFGVATTFLVYKVSRHFFNKKTGLIASLLYASSTLSTLYDRKYWNAFLSSFLALSVVLLTKQIIKTQSNTKIFVLAFLLSLGIHAHMTGLVMVVYVALFFLKNPINKKALTKLVLVFMLFQVPLVVFDMRHNFINTRALVQLFTNKESTDLPDSTNDPFKFNLVVNTIARALYTPAEDISNELTLCTELADQRKLPPKTYQILALIVFGSAIWLAKKSNPVGLLVVVNILLVVLYGLFSPGNFYSGQSAEYYLLPALPFFFIVSAVGVAALLEKYPIIAYTTVIFLVTINIHTTLKLKHSYGFSQKQATVSQIIENVDSQPFSLYVHGHPCQIYGYRFLFSQKLVEPSISYLDSTLGWIYQDRLPKEAPQIRADIYLDSATIEYTSLPTNQAR